MDSKQQFKREITIISGIRDIGKTKLCLLLIQMLQNGGMDIKGVVSPGLYEKGNKIGILARDIASGNERKLASYVPGWDAKRPEREWLFEMNAVLWANNQLEKAVPADYLLIDELGYLEFEENKGWTAGLDILDAGRYNHAFVVVRPDLLDLARKRWQNPKLVMVEGDTHLDFICGKLLNHIADNAEK